MRDVWNAQHSRCQTDWHTDKPAFDKDNIRPQFSEQKETLPEPGQHQEGIAQVLEHSRNIQKLSEAFAVVTAELTGIYQAYAVDVWILGRDIGQTVTLLAYVDNLQITLGSFKLMSDGQERCYMPP